MTTTMSAKSPKDCPCRSSRIGERSNTSPSDARRLWRKLLVIKHWVAVRILTLGPNQHKSGSWCEFVQHSCILPTHQAYALT
jgi:hypothetical protein